MNLKTLRVGMIAATFLFVSNAPGVWAQDGGIQAEDSAADMMALSQLSDFLMDSVARRTFAQQKGGQALQVNNYVEKFPDYAQKELMEIVMIIMRESKAGAMKHVAAFQSQGKEGATNSFSPAVKTRIDNLVRRLNADKQFMAPSNLNQMKQSMPDLGGKSS